MKQIHPEVTRRQVRQLLSELEPYTLHRRLTKPKRFRRTWTFAPKDLWQIDLLDMQKFKNENKGYRYLCVIIDTFSKFVWVKPLKDKTGKSLVKALSLIIMNERPKKIMADQGSEFYNKTVKKMLEAFGPKLYYVFSEKKASIVERVQRTLRGRIGRLFTQNNNNNWIDHIDDVVESYNNTYHSSIKMKPAKVSEKHYAKIRLRLFPGQSPNRAKFQVGQKVRIFAQSKKFSKEFEGRWTTEIFRIKEVKQTVPVTYLLEDLDKEPVLGSFYKEELQHVN